MQSTRLFAPATGLFRGLARNHTQTSAVSISGQRYFSNTFHARNEDTTKTPEAVEAAGEESVQEEEEVEPVKLSRRRRRFHEWANGNGSKYSRPAKGTTNYLGTSNVNYTHRNKPNVSEITNRFFY